MWRYYDLVANRAFNYMVKKQLSTNFKFFKDVSNGY